METRFVAGLLLAICALSQVISRANAAEQSPDAMRLVGTWQLVSIADGSPNRGDKPIGLIYYDAKGNMAAQIMPSRARAKFAGTTPTPEEARDALLGYTAYFGTYTVDEKNQTVTHHRLGNISPGGLNDVVRRYEFLSDDRIVLRPVENKSVLTWERLK